MIKYKKMKYQKERKRELLCKDTYKGFQYYILNLGTHPTAYVRLPEGHKYYEKNYDEIDIEVHGGLTYSQFFLMHPKANEEGWYIGWDYAHCGDYLGYDDWNEWMEKAQFKKWTTEEIIKECKNVIDQLVEAQNERN